MLLLTRDRMPVDLESLESCCRGDEDDDDGLGEVLTLSSTFVCSSE